MNKRTCTIAGCERVHRSRGLCGSHYNQTYLKNRHKKKLVACAFCGKEVERWGGGGRKSGSVCSYQCRQWLVTPYCKLPEDHWARWFGKASAWIPPKDDLPRFISNTCNECGAGFIEVNHNNTSLYCGPTCQRRVIRRTRKASEHGSVGSFRWIEVVRLWIDGDKMCAYCDTVIQGQPDPDHVVPISRGGRNDIGNIVPCCHLCNSDKCDLTLSEWAIERARLGKEPRRYHLPFSNPRFRHLTAGEATGTAWRHSIAA